MYIDSSANSSPGYHHSLVRQARTAHRAALDSGAAGLPFGRMRGLQKAGSNIDDGGLDIFVDAEFGAWDTILMAHS